MIRVIAGEYPGSPDLATARTKPTELLSLGVTTIIDITEPSEGLRDEGTVYLHCWGGIGRTGMIAGCALVRRGPPPSGALYTVEHGWRGTAKAQTPRHAKTTSPETVEQMRVLAK